MYFEHLNALFFHPGKTAGTSVEKLLMPGTRDARQCDHRQLFGWDSQLGCYLQHATVKTAREVLDDIVYDSSFRFMAVRNPYSRLISVYHYAFPSHEQKFGGFRQFVLSLPELVERKDALSGNHYSPQYLFATLDDEPVCHHIIYFENIERDFRKVAEHLGIGQSLKNLHPYRHSSFGSGPVSDRYDPAMIAAMQKAYARDFEFFGYPDEPDGHV